MVDSVSLMRNGYEYGTVPDRRGTIHTESGHVENSVSRMRSHPEYVVAMKHVEIGIQSTALTSDDLDTPRALVLAYCVVCSSPIMVEHYIPDLLVFITIWLHFFIDNFPKMRACNQTLLSKYKKKLST